jgi:enoyl-CoA hydratase
MVKQDEMVQLILNRPDVLNVMDDGFFDALHQHMVQFDEDTALRCVVLAAEGRHFSAGLDLKAASNMFLKGASLTSKAALAGSVALGQVAGTSPTSPTESGMPAMRNQRLYRQIKRWQGSISSLQQCRLPVIAACHGQCVGSGVDLVTAADIRLCTKDTVFSVKETNVGIVADLGTLHRLGHIVGRGIARELAFTGRPLKADRALSTGFVNEVYDTKDEMMEGAMRLAQEISANSALAVQGTKHVMNFAEENSLEAGLEHVALWNSSFLKSDDLVQAMVGFLQKRPPNYSDHVVPDARHRFRCSCVRALIW